MHQMLQHIMKGMIYLDLFWSEFFFFLKHIIRFLTAVYRQAANEQRLMDIAEENLPNSVCH